MDNKQIKRKRREILLKIDLLNKKRCDNCAGYQGNESNTESVMQCKCDAAVKVRNLGARLESLTRERPWESKVKEIKKKKSISVNEYLDLQFYNVHDVVIIRVLSVSQSHFRKWKSEVGLVHLRNTSEIKLQEIRRKNGHKRFIKTYGRIKA